jgi:anti-sigma factor RsiW
MIETPVTEDELHAYIDGELPADRLAAVEAWLSGHPEDAAKVAHWRAQAEHIRTRYGAVANENVPARLGLDKLLRRKRSWVGIAAAATVAAFMMGGAVGWMARGASAAAPSAVELLTEDALAAHRLYTVEVRHPVEVPGAERPHLTQWLSKRIGYDLAPPELDSIGLKLVGGRLLPGPAGAAAFYMYERASGERFTLYCSRTKAAATAMRFSQPGRNAALTWVDHGVAYVIAGPAERDALTKVAKAAYEQIDADKADKKGGS